MKRYLVRDKRVGETPLNVIETVKHERPDLAGVPMAYAGRLDPMASGKLLILIGDECKKQEKYHGLDKAYEFEILFNFTSDTGDVLGLADAHHKQVPDEHALASAISNLTGTIELPYPHYSSKTVSGKPLFLWTLENRLSEIEIPTATSRIFDLRYGGSCQIKGSDLLEDIIDKIHSLPPVLEESKKLGEDFRREPIDARWRELLRGKEREIFHIARFSVICSSGTYIRSLAPHIAQLTGSKGLAYSIHRTHIGRYIPLPKLGGFWFKKFH